ncbi:MULTISPECIES: ABC transporter substrate-binding protein [unclassified Mycolicibacterium]|uniref:ABC transporter substrate-binding protein n=1 Tax=unclassified Mycolicibacterium TaxID=2636767 RepID=UPI00130CD87B|nr:MULTISPECIES: ABC transporter substrate-binding protein [unclassified Mycolicibacterium]MUL82582.1 ABC transporter substrate-binding protein [Mycolicibacterium sp. CBMA 329]MUL88917.1 ABC transporter substrate-binding protein [Mycolicibacterium sp. CBMA 331]MUL97485.1 ABC transporter substrate-binding protein [Mycolicibacterium sp. CBMA 334]MUM26790.1 ABC transporter substrate-binding protein [Mycolicibacterium sp. CBMA 295]MUM38433.1 ABC transporter substrate-binding protein [Mycolicibacte
MPTTWSRRGFLTVTAALTLVTACSTQKPGEVAKDGSVTVRHLFGDTTIPGPPARVVSAGFTEQDDLLALGVIPIATTEWFGGEPFAVWPWAQRRLGAAQPAVLALTDGIQVDAIAALKPDLIVATNAGLDADTYAKLSEIAPTLAQSGPDAFFEPWRDQATLIGQALFQKDAMTGLIAGVDDKLKAVATNNPRFAGKKAMLLGGTLFRDSVQTRTGWRTEFLTQMGFVVPPTPELIPRGDMAPVLDAADVLIWTTEGDEERAALLADPAIAGLRATARKRHVFTTKDLTGAIAFASPLSYPLVADQLPPLLNRALT